MAPRPTPQGGPRPASPRHRAPGGPVTRPRVNAAPSSIDSRACEVAVPAQWPHSALAAGCLARCTLPRSSTKRSALVTTVGMCDGRLALNADSVSGVGPPSATATNARNALRHSPRAPRDLSDGWRTIGHDTPIRASPRTARAVPDEEGSTSLGGPTPRRDHATRHWTMETVWI